jgi:hypothetical protein
MRGTAVHSFESEKKAQPPAGVGGKRPRGAIGWGFASLLRPAFALLRGLDFTRCCPDATSRLLHLPGWGPKGEGAVSGPLAPGSLAVSAQPSPPFSTARSASTMPLP